MDLTALMDFIDLTGIPYPALPSFVIVEMILAKYLLLGVVPLALPASIPSFENPLDHFVKQQGTDYSFVNSWPGGMVRFFTSIPGRNPEGAWHTMGPTSANCLVVFNRPLASILTLPPISIRSASPMTGLWLPSIL